MEPEASASPSTLDETATAFVTEAQRRTTGKIALRRLNLAAGDTRPDEAFLRKLDSNLKKTTAFVKKLKSLTEAQRSALLKDFEALNLSKYAGEMAANVVEARLKMSDVPLAVELASRAHQRYGDFAEALLEQLKKALPRKKTDKVVNPSKLRVDVRLLAELTSTAVVNAKEALPVLGAALAVLVQTDKTEHQKNVRLLLTEYYGSLRDRLVDEHKEMRRLERRNRRLYESKGEVFADARARLEAARASVDRLTPPCLTLADLLDVDPPTLSPADATDDDGLLYDDSGMIVSIDPSKVADETGGVGLWEDEDQRQFYETLPELRQMLPRVLFTDSETPTLAPVGHDMEQIDIETETSTDVTADAEEEETEGGQDEADDETQLVAEDAMDETATDDAPVLSTYKLMMQAFLTQMPTLVNRDMIDKAAIDFCQNLNTKSNRKQLLSALFAVPRTRLDLLPFYSRLTAVLNPVMPDVATALVQSLVSELRVHVRRKNQLRIESKIRTCRYLGELTKFGVCPKSEALYCLKLLLFDFRHHNIDMACALLDVSGYFLYHSPDSHQKTKILLEQMLRKRDIGSLDQRYQLMIDNAFYTSNPPITGPKLHQELPAWQQYVKQLIFKDLGRTTVEKVLRQLRKLDWSQQEVKNDQSPPNDKGETEEEGAEEGRLSADEGKTDTTAAAGPIETVVPADYVISCLASPHLVRYGSIQWLASLLAGLMYFHDWVGHRVIDAVLESIHLGMEVNLTEWNQRRIAAVRYLGEMYNYRVVDSAVVFKVLYSLITVGTSGGGGTESGGVWMMDPPQHLFRIRLVATLLDTCGEYFDRGISKKKLDCYLVYLQRYYWQKKSADCWSNTHEDDENTQRGDDKTAAGDQQKPTKSPVPQLPQFPLEVDNLMTELRDKLRPKLQLFANPQEAADGVKLIEEEYREKVEALLRFVSASDHQQSAGGGGGETTSEDEDERTMRPIEEEDEDTTVPVDAHSQPDGDNRQYLSVDEEANDDLLDEDAAVHVKQAKSVEKTEEDLEFEAAYDRMMAEMVQQRVREAPKIAQSEIVVPQQARAKLERTTTFALDSGAAATDGSAMQLGVVEGGGRETPEEEERIDGHQQRTTLSFALLTKGKGNKPTLKAVKVSDEDSIAHLWKDREAADDAEKQRIKQLTLNMSARQEQEELAEAEGSLRKAFIFPARPAPDERPKKKQFQHQKGAPSLRSIYSDWN